MDIDAGLETKAGVPHDPVITHGETCGLGGVQGNQ